jgi:hypothetical protein
MKDWNSLSGKAQSEALLNEIKGNIFEFLLASHLCRQFGVEGEFLRSFSSVGSGRALDDLKSYQTWLRSSDPELYSRLPELASEVGQKLLEKSGALNEVSLENIYVTGKAGAVSGQDSFKEADLWLKTKSGDIPLSLKLCKKGAFVNTKSGGIRSFITKYFSEFSRAESLQRELNNYLEQSFYEMAQSLYEWADLPFEQESFKTQFSPAWVENGFSELPGELPMEARKFLFAHYHRVITKLFNALEVFYLEDSELFGRSLGPLVGMGLENMVQVTCFHNESKSGGRYQLAELQSYGWREFQKGVQEMKFGKLHKDISSFEISFGRKRLQIRVKPMNKFTVSALKVNCSLKDDRS